MQQMRFVDSYALNKNVFRLFLNMTRDMSSTCSSAGRLIHTRGLWTVKLWLVLVHGTVSRPERADFSCQLLTVDASLQYDCGAMPC